MREVVYFAIFWLAALLGMLFFIFGDQGFAEGAVGAAVVALAWALKLEWDRRRGGG